MPKRKITVVTILALTLFWALGVNAQTVLNGNVPPGFLQAGYIENATLNGLGGGTLTMNGITMIVPANTVVQFPANTLTWAQLFNSGTNLNPVYDSALSSAQVSPAITLGATGLAMADNPGILGYTAAAPSGLGPEMPFNAIVQGNIDVQNKTGNGAGAYIIGLILPINQDVGNGGVGFINCIDYTKGRFEVGGTASTLPGGACGATPTGTVIELNDPTGRYGFAHSPDPRWSVDPDNPTVSSLNGYPMGIPKVNPATGNDPDRPAFNRPLNTPAVDPFLQPGAPLIAFSMPPSGAPGATQPDPWKQAPLVVGDYVLYTGVLYSNNPKAFLNPLLPINQQTYVSANTVTAANLMIYTAPGRPGRVGPAYIQISGRMVIGNGGDVVIVPPNPGGAAGILGGTIPNLDPKLNIDIRGYCTDPTALVDIYAVDVSTSGTASLRLLGTVIPDSGVAGVPAPKGTAGRFRLQVGVGDFLPTTRAYAAVTEHGTVQLNPQVGNIIPANGLLAGQYQAPMFNFIFPDAPQGFPAIPTNFNTMPFLFMGEGGNLSAGPLTPFPPFTP